MHISKLSIRWMLKMELHLLPYKILTIRKKYTPRNTDRKSETLHNSRFNRWSTDSFEWSNVQTKSQIWGYGKSSPTAGITLSGWKGYDEGVLSEAVKAEHSFDILRSDSCLACEQRIRTRTHNGSWRNVSNFLHETFQNQIIPHTHPKYILRAFTAFLQSWFKPIWLFCMGVAKGRIFCKSHTKQNTNKQRNCGTVHLL